jgi:K+-sensing histidine kinase KdpD
MRGRTLATWALWLTLLAVATIAMANARGRFDQVHVVLTYLLIVLGASASGGRGLGISLACLCFVLIDYFFQPPYGALTIGKAPDWLTLVAFLATAFVATHLLARAQAEAAEARRLGAERVRLVAEAEHAEALREADRLKDHLLAGVSHDLRTPLTTIKALAQSEAMQGNRAAAAIEEQADRLSQFVTDLLDLSRLRSGGFAVNPELNTAEDLIGAAVRQTAGLLGGRQLKTVVDLESPALVGHFDFAQSLRILGNLLENAIRYSPPSQPIELSARREGAELVFMVSDHGPGVPPAALPRIFEPFYRAAETVPDRGRAGLGLSIAKRLAEMQGGHVTYAPRPGGGSMFALRIPAAENVLTES